MDPKLKLVLLVFMTSFMLQCGLAAPRGSLATAARRVREIVSALLLMLVAGPILAVLVGRAFGLEGPAAAALLVLSVVGVVPLAPRGAKQAKGDVPLATVVMLALALIAAFTASSAARAVLSYWGYKAFFAIGPGALLLQLLLLQVIPLAAGLALRSRSERAAWLEKAVAVVNTVAFAIILLLVIAPRLGDLGALGIRGAAAGLVFAALLAALGWVFGGPDVAGRRTFAAIVNMPNIALALALEASANAPPVYAVTLVAMFLLRMVAGVAIQVALRRSARRAVARPARRPDERRPARRQSVNQ